MQCPVPRLVCRSDQPYFSSTVNTGDIYSLNTNIYVLLKYDRHQHHKID